MKFAFNVVTLVTSLVLCSGLAVGNRSSPCLVSTGSLNRVATDGKSSSNVTWSSRSCPPGSPQDRPALSFAQNEPLPWQVPSPLEGLAPVSVEPMRLFKRAPLPAPAPAGTAGGFRAKVRPALTQAGVALKKGGAMLKAGAEKAVKTTKEWVNKAKTKMGTGAQKPAGAPTTPPVTPPKPGSPPVAPHTPAPPPSTTEMQIVPYSPPAP